VTKNNMTDHEFIERILEIPEESQTLEFKRLGEEGIVKKILETIVAMANADGGLIVLGISDPEKTKRGERRVYGIEENKDVCDAISREIPKVIPPLTGIWPPNLLKWNEKETVAMISVPKCTDDFRCWGNDVFLREQKSNRRLTPQEIVTFAYAKGFRRADIELVDVAINLLDTVYFQAWKQHRGITGNDISEVLEKTGLARRDDMGVLKPTRAAVLLFAEYPTNLMDTKCAIRILQYAGKEESIKNVPNLIGVPETLQGPASRLIQLGQERVLSILRSGVAMPGSGFITQYRLPERAVKEAITNAVIHRDYHAKRDIEIKIFEDRIEIENTGLFPFNITPSNIGSVRATGYRNDLLVKILREFPDPPNLDQNEGVRAIRNEMKARNLYPPIYLTYPYLQDSVRVILLNESAPSEWEKVQSYLQKNKYIGNSDARKVTGVVEMTHMSKMLKRWVAQGLLIRVDAKNGAPKMVKYRLPDLGQEQGLLANQKASKN